MTTIPIIGLGKGRTCDGCTKCCEGWLSADIYGFKMNTNDGSCKFLAKKECSIYPVRPKLCKDYLCGWRQFKKIPDQLKPDLCNAIIVGRRIQNYFYYRMIEAGRITESVFIWAEKVSTEGEHVVGFMNGNISVWSKDKNFIDLIYKEYDLR